MRVLSSVERVEIAPGSTGVIPFEVVNTTDVIDSLSVRALGIPTTHVQSDPEQLTLFPHAAGELALTITLPDAFPAGEYPVTFVVQGRSTLAVEAFHDIEIVVPAVPGITATAAPTVVRSRGRAVFTVRVTNTGNVPLDLALRTVDTDRALRTSVTPSTLSVPVGRSATSTVIARGPRQLLGSDRDRQLRVVAEAEGAKADVPLTLRQRSTFSRGLITILVLLAIVAAWALAFGLGMRQVLGVDPYTKVAPGSFFAASDAAAEGGAGAGGADAQNAAAGDASAAPAGALPKEGALPAGVGATITGTVRGAEDPAGVGRLTVDALRSTRDGLVLVSSAATQADGTYTLAGLFPGDYLVRVATDGYETLWYPLATTPDAATAVTASAQKVTEGINLAVVGEPATISGLVDTGQPAGDVPVTVTATPTWEDPEAEDGATASPPIEVQADDTGAYTFTNLVAPGTYELTFEAEGYQPTTSTERVLGGQQRIALDVQLGAGTGQVAGLVTDGTKGLGGVTVSTTVDGEEVVVGTPTLGQVGSFVVPSLPTPATYVLTFSKDGFGSRTVVVDLGAGETRTDVDVTLTGGAGTVSGHVVDEKGAGLGGVTVTAGGASAGATATTLTAGDVGAFTLTGVRGPGAVTLTFTKDGYTPASIPVNLGEGAVPDARVTLTTALGSIQGRVVGGADGTTGVAGLRVEATDGTTVHSTTSTAGGSSGGGSYILADLPAGTYTVSVVQDGATVASAEVTVRRGAPVSQDLPLSGGG